MGGVFGSRGGPKLTPDEKKRREEEALKTRQIDEVNEKDQMEDLQVVKLLLLGAGESGKSTLFKQMVALYGKGWTDKDRSRYIEIFHTNTLDCMQNVLKATEKLNATLGLSTKVAAENEEAMKFILSLDPNSDRVSDVVADHWKNLWADPGVALTMENRSKFQLLDSAEYLFSRIDSMSKPAWVPTDSDIMRTRIKTTGVIETEFTILETRFKMVDVGGQRSERKKWIHCFENVTAVIFVAALSEYNQKCIEDDETNRLDESLDLFNQMCNSKWLTNTAMILFLNKSDLLQAKLSSGVSFKVYDPEYTGDDSFESVTEHIEGLFLAQNLNPKRKIYTHVTCATDSENIKHVFHAVKDIIVRQSLMGGGLVS